MTTFDEVSGSMDAILDEFTNIQEKMRKEMQEKMGVLFKAFFETFPEVKTIHWTQYTPYFNDGEECVFSVSEVYFTKTEWDSEDPELEHYGDDDPGLISGERYNWTTKKYEPTGENSPELERAIRKMSDILQSSDDIMLAMFENHVWVRAHKDGFEVEEYEHD